MSLGARLSGRVYRDVPFGAPFGALRLGAA